MTKAAFVKELHQFLHSTNIRPDITRMEYVEDGYDEWVYIWEGNVQKRICVNMDSNWAILIDFMKQEPNADWILEDAKKFENIKKGTN